MRFGCRPKRITSFKLIRRSQLCANPESYGCNFSARRSIFEFRLQLKLRSGDLETSKLLCVVSNGSYREAAMQYWAIGQRRLGAVHVERPMPLDFDSFGDGQRILKLNAEVSDSTVHLGMPQ